MLNGVAVAPVMPAPVGAALADNETVPRFEGFQLQVTELLEPEPVVDFALQPGRTFPFTVKVTFEETEILAVITTDDLKVAVVAEPASASELNAEVSTISVTVIVIDCVPALAAASVAVSVMS